MLWLEFEGWFQCRLATDPDPSDEPRGVSGCSFATVGEPDLDRRIRLQPAGVVHRSHMPTVGVDVTHVAIDGESKPGHELVGAGVDLVEGKFEEQNGIVAEANRGVIDPFDLRISTDSGLEVRRAAMWDPKDPSKTVYDLTLAQVKYRQPSAEVNSPEVYHASGVLDPDAWLAKRQKALEDELGKATEPLEKAALRQRLDSFEREDFCRIRHRIMLGVQARYNFTLNAPDMEANLGDAVPRDADRSAEWPVEFWMGAWDNDALCAYMKGRLVVPLTAS